VATIHNKTYLHHKAVPSNDNVKSELFSFELFLNFISVSKKDNLSLLVMLLTFKI